MEQFPYDTGGARLRIETKQWRTIAHHANPQVLLDRYPRSVTDENGRCAEAFS
jgi:hypothetical protein